MQMLAYPSISIYFILCGPCELVIHLQPVSFMTLLLPGVSFNPKIHTKIKHRIRITNPVLDQFIGKGNKPVFN